MLNGIGVNNDTFKFEYCTKQRNERTSSVISFKYYVNANVKTRHLSQVHDSCYILDYINLNILGVDKCLVSNFTDMTCVRNKNNLKLTSSVSSRQILAIF